MHFHLPAEPSETGPHDALPAAATDCLLPIGSCPGAASSPLRFFPSTGGLLGGHARGVWWG
jgi:hypothetical protein